MDATKRKSIRSAVKDSFHELLALLFPPFCIHCGRPLVGNERDLCTPCLIDIPWNQCASIPNNDSEIRLSGRIPFQAACSLLNFSKGNIGQSIVHQIKYHGNTHLAHQFGRFLGEEIVKSGRFSDIDIIVPVPLHWWRQMRRGYNQSALICEGIAEVMGKPISQHNLYRKRYTKSQTKKGRFARMLNMQYVFAVRHPERFQNKHILLVDDVLTTGATTSSCAEALAPIPGIRFSIATLAIVQH